MNLRQQAIDAAYAQFDTGTFRARLADLIAVPSESQRPNAAPGLGQYIDTIAPLYGALGFETETVRDAVTGLPFLIATRHQDADLPTILSYGHGDTVLGMTGEWTNDRDPFALSEAGPLWYGRGIVDNKGQHLVNLMALSGVLGARGGRLGYNLIVIIEMGEEVGSPGLRTLCADRKDQFKADLFLASDGPRQSAKQPTVFLGARGGYGVELRIKRREGGRHSGNFGGLLANPGTELANAIASIVDANGHLKIAAWAPPNIPAATRAALENVIPAGGEIDPGWGAPGLTPAERVHAWSSAEVLAFSCGDPHQPMNAIPPEAWAHLQLRYVVGVDPDQILPALRQHLDTHGFAHVTLTPSETAFAASQTPIGHPFAQFIAGSITDTFGARPTILPSLGGSLPNDIFTDLLGLPAVWVPHSYPGCSQHAPNEHVPAALFREALGLMAGIWWDIGDAGRADLGI